MTTKGIATKDTETGRAGTYIEVNYTLPDLGAEVMMTLTIGDKSWMFPIEVGRRLANALQEQANEAQEFSGRSRL